MSTNIKEYIIKICDKPNDVILLLKIFKIVNGGRLKPIPKAIKKGVSKSFSNYSDEDIYSHVDIFKDISLVDVVNLTHPKPNQRNYKSLKFLVRK